MLEVHNKSTKLNKPDKPRHTLAAEDRASGAASALRAAQRDDSLDVAKGFGIFLVVLGHCLDGLIGSGFFPAWIVWPTLTVYAIYLFHMPLFFVVSGHLASGKHRPAKTTLARLLPTIVYPYFLWSILQWLVLAYLSRYTNNHSPTSSLYKILWIPVVPYWFLYALFLCQAGYLAVRRLPYWAQLGIAVTVFLVSQAFWIRLELAHLSIVLDTTRGFLYFILGVVSVAQVKRLGRWTAIVATVLFAVFAVVYYRTYSMGFVAAPVALAAGIAGILATLAWSRMLATNGGRVARTLAFWGRYSMSIYVLHIFFTAGTRIALKRLATASAPTMLATGIEIVSATGLGIALPLAVNWIVSKSNLDRWFGLQHMEIA